MTLIGLYSVIKDISFLLAASAANIEATEGGLLDEAGIVTLVFFKVGLSVKPRGRDEYT
ncbi:hypothetical protein [Nitrincola tibetensis]|uniref:hypothetical protein n=1 Tax=Nitrincola tibetensis TaxID=2219697 RepID=UPI0012E3D46E|nr:hypothetical protein [Nitrincola tibetensis]